MWHFSGAVNTEAFKRLRMGPAVGGSPGHERAGSNHERSLTRGREAKPGGVVDTRTIEVGGTRWGRTHQCQGCELGFPSMESYWRSQCSSTSPGKLWAELGLTPSTLFLPKNLFPGYDSHWGPTRLCSALEPWQPLTLATHQWPFAFTHKAGASTQALLGPLFWLQAIFPLPPSVVQRPPDDWTHHVSRRGQSKPWII